MYNRYLETLDLPGGETIAAIDYVERLSLGTLVHLRGLKPLCLLDGRVMAELARAFMDPNVVRWRGRNVVLSAVGGEVHVRGDARQARVEPDHLHIRHDTCPRIPVPRNW